MYRTVAQTAFSQNNLQENFNKGDAFENYIITLFNQKNFKLLEWRNSKQASNGAYPLNNVYPDLEFYFQRKGKYQFAIECKWREKFEDGKIEWAKAGNIDAYVRYQKEKNIRVFVAIGIGGSPSQPEKLFITPLDNIKMYTELYECNLMPYTRRPAQRFFYDTIQMKLF